MEPDWRVFGRGEGGAMSDLIQLAEQLGCREEPRALRREQAQCLLHGLGTVLAAIEDLGGGHALARRDKGAALCLGRCLVEVAWGVGYGDVTDELRSRVVWAFRRLGPDMLPAAAAGLRSGAPGSEEHACAAARLTAALMGVDNSLDDNGPVEDWPDDWFEDWPNAERQVHPFDQHSLTCTRDMTSTGIRLLDSIALLPYWSPVYPDSSSVSAILRQAA